MTNTRQQPGPKPPPGWFRAGPQHYYLRLTPQVAIECKRVKGIDPPWCYYLKVDAPGVSARPLIARSYGKPATIADAEAWIRAAVEFIDNERLYLSIISEAAGKAEGKIKELGRPPIPKGGSFRAHLMALEMESQTQSDEG
jgi:hypothetical protein